MILKHALALPLLALVSLSSAQSTDTLQLPFKETFSDTELDPSWTEIQSSGCTVEVSDDALHIRSVENGQAHIQRQVDQDNITVTAKANFDSSVYLVWDKNNWIGLGKFSPTPFGRFTTTLTIDGVTSMTQHRGTDYAAMHLLRIELGNNLVRFLYSNSDKTNWQPLRTIERTGAFKKPPTIVSFGTRYDSNPGPLGDPATIDTSTTTTKDRGVTTVDDIEIKKTSPASLSMTPDEKRYLHTQRPEPVNNLLVTSQDDPTYEQVASFYPAMKSPREITGVPAHPLDIGVDYQGRFDVSPWTKPIAWLEFGDPAVPFAETNDEIKSRKLLDGHIPIITLTREKSGIAADLTILGWSEDFSPDNDLFAYAHLAMTANAGVHLPQKIALAGQDNKRVEWNPEHTNRSQLELYFKFKYPDPETAVEISKEEFDAIHADTAAMWKKRIAAVAHITTPDEMTNNVYKALWAYALLNTDIVDGELEPHDGAGFYDLPFGHSVSLHAMAADMYNMPGYAETIFDGQLSRQKEDGSYVSECGLVDLASLLTAMTRHYEMTHNKEWLERVSSNIIKGCEWLIARRAESGDDPKVKGLIKFRPYNDFPQPTYNYVGNTLSCVALQECAKVLRLVDKNAEADKFAAESKQYRADIYASMEAAKFTRDGMTILPIEPDTQRILKLSSYTGGEYYGLTASQMMGTEFFRPDDEFPTYLIDMLENRHGLVAGVTEFQEGIDHAYSYGYLMSQLERDNPRKVILAWWSMTAYGMTRETHSPVEISMIKTGENHYTLPHLYSCTEQLRLLRYMLLREEGENLVLGQAIPRDWLQPGKKTAIDSLATQFGPASFAMEALDDKTVQIDLTPPSRNPAKTIEVHVRHPSGKDIVEATSASGEKLNFTDEIITIPGDSKPGTITVKF